MHFTRFFLNTFLQMGVGGTPYKIAKSQAGSLRGPADIWRCRCKHIAPQYRSHDCQIRNRPQENHATR
ncbi:hypothetical protein TH15_02535 [Thalassospira profundimaris]|nr:hypothetical protein TH15_02535 [Thalassospira profundimaris]